MARIDDSAELGGKIAPSPPPSAKAGPPPKPVAEVRKPKPAPPKVEFFETEAEAQAVAYVVDCSGSTNSHASLATNSSIFSPQDVCPRRPLLPWRFDIYVGNKRYLVIWPQGPGRGDKERAADKARRPPSKLPIYLGIPLIGCTVEVRYALLVLFALVAVTVLF